MRRTFILEVDGPDACTVNMTLRYDREGGKLEVLNKSDGTVTVGLGTESTTEEKTHRLFRRVDGSTFELEATDGSGVAGTGCTKIALERMRQRAREGHSPEHDDTHRKGELALAAICYAAPPDVTIMQERLEPRTPGSFMPTRVYYQDPWPWDVRDDKRERHDPIRRLEIAGALLAAEIDRLLRLEAK